MPRFISAESGNAVCPAAERLLHRERDLSQRFERLIVAGDKANNRTGAYDGDGEPDDASEWPAKPVLFPHRDQRVNDAD